MKIKRLQSENIKRISVVDITPDGNLVIIGGKNGAGKSSVLDSIAYVIGGEKLAPANPIRKGQTSAKVRVEIDDYVATRTYRYKAAECVCQPEEMGTLLAPEHAHDCPSLKPPVITSTLTVTNAAGARYPSPQGLLDKLYGKLTFDPLAFKNLEPPKQAEILRALAGLDFRDLDARRKAAFDERAMHKKTLAIEERRLADMPSHPSAVAVSVASIAEEMKEARKAQARVVFLRRESEEATRVLGVADSRVSSLGKLVDELAAKLAQAQTELDSAKAYRAQAAELETAKAAELDEAEQRVPDMAPLDERLRGAEAENARVEASKRRTEQQRVVDEWTDKVQDAKIRVEALDLEKAEALASAKFPIDGLGVTDDGVTFEGLPLAEVSSSVQLRTSIAIGLALNPTLKVLLIRNGNLLDEESLKLVAEQAAAADAQVWMEYVTSNADGVSVLLEDGHAADRTVNAV